MATLLNLIGDKKYSEIDILAIFSKIGEKNPTDMVNFALLKDAFRELNFEAHGYQINRKIFELISIPVIVKIESDPRFPHFVVAINKSGDFIKILDLNCGEYISKKSEFYSVWDKFNKGGYVLIANPKNNKKISTKFAAKFLFYR